MTAETKIDLLLLTDLPALAGSIGEALDSAAFSIRVGSPSDEPPAEEPADIILMVIRAGRTDDLERCAVWVDALDDVEVIAVVEDGDASIGERALEDGARCWIPASFDAERLGAIVARAAQARLSRARQLADHGRYLRLLEHAPIGVFEIEGGRITYVNDHLLDKLGYDREEIVGTRPEDLQFLSPIERSRVLAAISERLAGHEFAEPNTYHFQSKAGTVFIGEADSRVVETPNGPRMEGTIRDITVETRLTQFHRVVLSLGEVILGEQSIDRILQLVLDTITEFGGFRRAVLALFDLSVPEPFEGETYKTLTSGLTVEERQEILRQPPMSIEERRALFSDRYRLGPAYYVPHDDTPWDEDIGISGTVTVGGWHKDDYLFIPLRGIAGIIGSISVDDPIDMSAPTVASIEPVSSLANLAAMAVERVYKINQLQHQKDRLHGLSVLGRDLSQARDLGALSEIVTARAREELDYGLCSIWVLQGNTLIHEAIATDGSFDESEIPERGASRPIDGPGLMSLAVRTGEPVLTHDAVSDARFDGAPESIRSFMAVPIVGRKGVLGVISTASPRVAAFGQQDAEVISALASQLATAISAVQRRASLARVFSFGQHLAAAPNRDQIIVSSLDSLVAQFGYHMCTVFLVDAQDRLRVAAIRGPRSDERAIGPGMLLPDEASVVAWVAETKRSALIADVSSDSRYYAVVEDTASELAVPILFRDRLLGVINIESVHPGYFDEEDRQLLEVLANHMAIALANLDAQADLREQAIRDPMTGLFNRHYFNSIIAGELSRGDRYERPMSLMMIDIDGFRAVNNRLGHLKGDDVLCEVASMLQEHVRTADCVIRYGGDEFLVLMPETDGHGDADTVAQRLREEIALLPRQTSIGDLTIGLSIGIYTRLPHETMTLESILEEVDRRMYADKRAKYAHRADDYRS